MIRHKVAVLAVLLAVLGTSLVTARQNIVLNGSMELGAGPGAVDPQVAAEWTEFGINVERSPTVNLEPPGDGYALKVFGDGDSTSAGAWQMVDDVTTGQSVSASVWVYTPTFDQLGGSGEAGLVLEFLDFFGGTITLHQTYPLNAFSPPNTWTPATIGPLTAPSGTMSVRVSCRLKWNVGDVSGAAYWDDAQLIVESGPSMLLNGDFEEAGASAGQSSVGIDEWLGFEDQEKSDDIALDGQYSLKLGVREAYNGLYQNMDVLNEGEHIILRGWVLNSASDPIEVTTRAGIKLEFDPNTNVPLPEENLAFDASIAPDQWTLVDLETTVPEGVNLARVVMIYMGDPAETGALYFDDAHAGVTSNPGDNLLLNESFEFGPGGPGGLTDWTDFGEGATAEKDCFNVYLTGICSLRAAGTSVAGVYQDVPVTPGQNLYISANIQTPSFEPIVAAGTLAGVKVEWVVGGVPDDIDLGQQDNEIDAGATPGVWIPLTIEFTMPPESSALARFTNLIIKGIAQDGTVYFDACEAVVLNRFDGSDVDRDDDEDLRDAAWLQRTFTGSGAGGLPFNGLTFDSDDDDDVDYDDAAYFAPRMTGVALSP
ncbi:MAG: hypothetical protein ABIG44_09110 [Planctomycetota bacterium]